jgi:hypothetical protein
MISQTELKYLLDYEPLSGNFIWRVNKCSRARVGQIAGTSQPQGYVYICLNRRIHLAHRLVFLHQTGEWPPFEVDHINGDKGDNSWANLRLATSSQNKANRSKFRGAMLKGVQKRGNRFIALVRVNSKLKYLGLYDTEEQAHAVYCEAAQKEFGAYHRVK